MLSSGCKSELKVWNIYKGEFGVYYVRIEETMRNDILTRLIHLEPMNGYEEPVPNPFAITGHDYDNDGQFDRIFIRELPENGYNSVTFTDKGERIWEPCLGDKDKVKPFTDAQVDSARAQLYLAMATFHNEKYLVNTLEIFRAGNEQ